MSGEKILDHFEVTDDGPHAPQTDGTHRHFTGTYTVHDGVIVSADVQQEGAG